MTGAAPSLASSGYNILADDILGFARKNSDYTPPPGSILKPIHGTGFHFETKNGRMESVNSIRILSIEHKIEDHEAAAHDWGKKHITNYHGFNCAIVNEIEELHKQVEPTLPTGIHFEVELREENGNKAHCDLKLIAPSGTQKGILNGLRVLVGHLFDKKFHKV